jgi:hypothetical protein
METLKKLVEFLNWPIFNAIDNLSSLTGLIISLVVLIKVKKIEVNYAGRIRIPTLLTRINSHASNLIKLMEDYGDAQNEIRLELGSMKAHLESLHKKVDKSIRKEIDSIVRLIERFDKNSASLTSLTKVDIILVKLKIKEIPNADAAEMLGNAKRDEVYRIYESVQTLLIKTNNLQEDKMLE